MVGATDDPDRDALTEAALHHAPGGAVVLAGEPDSVPLLADRPLVDGHPAAYVCHGLRVRPPGHRGGRPDRRPVLTPFCPG